MAGGKVSLRPVFFRDVNRASGVSAAAPVVIAAIAAASAAAAVVGSNRTLIAQGHGREERQREEFVAYVRRNRRSSQGRIGMAGIENQGELMGILRDTGAIGVPPCLLAKDNLFQASAEQQVLQPCRSASKKLTNPVA